MILTIKPSNCQTFTKDHQQQDCSSTRISVKQLKYVHTTLKKVFSFVYVVSSIFIVYMYSQTLSWSLTKVPEIPLITVKLTCIKRGTCIKRSPFGNGSLTAQYRLTVFLIQVWQTWDLFKKMKVKSEISIPRQIDLHLLLVPLHGPKEKKLKTAWRHTRCDLLHWFGTSSQSERLMEVKTIKNKSLGPRVRWPRPLNTGQFYSN